MQSETMSEAGLQAPATSYTESFDGGSGAVTLAAAPATPQRSSARRAMAAALAAKGPTQRATTRPARPARGGGAAGAAATAQSAGLAASGGGGAFDVDGDRDEADSGAPSSGDEAHSGDPRGHGGSDKPAPGGGRRTSGPAAELTSEETAAGVGSEQAVVEGVVSAHAHDVATQLLLRQQGDRRNRHKRATARTASHAANTSSRLHRATAAANTNQSGAPQQPDAMETDAEDHSPDDDGDEGAADLNRPPSVTSSPMRSASPAAPVDPRPGRKARLGGGGSGGGGGDAVLEGRPGSSLSMGATATDSETETAGGRARRARKRPVWQNTAEYDMDGDVAPGEAVAASRGDDGVPVGAVLIPAQPQPSSAAVRVRNGGSGSSRRQQQQSQLQPPLPTLLPPDSPGSSRGVGIAGSRSGSALGFSRGASGLLPTAGAGSPVLAASQSPAIAGMAALSLSSLPGAPAAGGAFAGVRPPQPVALRRGLGDGASEFARVPSPNLAWASRLGWQAGFAAHGVFGAAGAASDPCATAASYYDASDDEGTELTEEEFEAATMLPFIKCGHVTGPNAPPPLLPLQLSAAPGGSPQLVPPQPVVVPTRSDDADVALRPTRREVRVPSRFAEALNSGASSPARRGARNGQSGLDPDQHELIARILSSQQQQHRSGADGSPLAETDMQQQERERQAELLRSAGVELSGDPREDSYVLMTSSSAAAEAELAARVAALSARLAERSFAASPSVGPSAAAPAASGPSISAPAALATQPRSTPGSPASLRLHAEHPASVTGVGVALCVPADATGVTGGFPAAPVEAACGSLQAAADTAAVAAAAVPLQPSGASPFAAISWAPLDAGGGQGDQERGDQLEVMPVLELPGAAADAIGMRHTADGTSFTTKRPTAGSPTGKSRGSTPPPAKRARQRVEGSSDAGAALLEAACNEAK